MFGQRRAGEFEVGLEHLDGVAGAALLGLKDELDAGGFDSGADAIGFVADDAEDVIGGDDSLGGGDDVEKEGAAADLVEDLGALAVEPRALACGHDGDGEVWGGHRPIWSHVRVCFELSFDEAAGDRVRKVGIPVRRDDLLTIGTLIVLYGRYRPASRLHILEYG